MTGSTKVVDFMNPGAWVLVLRLGHIIHIVKLHYLLSYQYTAHSLCLYKRIIMLLSDFHLFYDGAGDMQP